MIAADRGVGQATGNPRVGVVRLSLSLSLKFTAGVEECWK
jgi:hypothetical protein